MRYTQPAHAPENIYMLLIAIWFLILVEIEERQSDMHTKNFTIGILSTTSAILLVGLIAIHSRPVQVYADGMTVSGGDYIVSVGANDDQDEEFIFIIDVPSEKLITYRFNRNQIRIEIVNGIDLAQMREAADQQPSSKPRPSYRNP